jgi:hypothetical protein
MGNKNVLRVLYEELMFIRVYCQFEVSSVVRILENITVLLCYSKTFFDTLKSHFGNLKRLMEGKRFSADVKCEDPVRVQFDGPNIFVSNGYLYGDETI